MNTISQQILKALDAADNVRSVSIIKLSEGEDGISYYTYAGSQFQDVVLRISYWAKVAEQFYDPNGKGSSAMRRRLIEFGASISNPTEEDKAQEDNYFTFFTDDVNEILKLI